MPQCDDISTALDVIECFIAAIKDVEDRAGAGRMFAHLRDYLDGIKVEATQSPSASASDMIT